MGKNAARKPAPSPSRRDFLAALAASFPLAGPGLPRVWAQLATAPSPLLASGPMSGRVTADSAIVNLVTAGTLKTETHFRVRWADSPGGLAQSRQMSSPVTTGLSHQRLELPLRGLRPNQPYHYRIESAAHPAAEWTPLGEPGFLHTQRPRGEPFSFCIVADPHWGHPRIRDHVAMQSGRRCLQQILADGPYDFTIDLGDSPYPVDARTREQSREAYLEWRGIMAEITRRMPTYLVLGNHEQEAGFYQDGDRTDDGLGNRLTPGQYHQKWATEARLLCVPNPRGDTYPEGGEGAAGCDSSGDWMGRPGPWNAGDWQHLQNFYAWTWGDALFVVLDPLRYTLPGSRTLPATPRQWTLGATQFRWLERTLAGSSARWKFVLSHHLVGGALIALDDDKPLGGRTRAYGRGSAIDAGRQGTEQARIHELMVKHGVQFFIYGHDHLFCHSVRDSVRYLCCGRPTVLNRWLRGERMKASYGDVTVQGTDKPWVRALYNVLGYTRFEVTPDEVVCEWVRTDFSFEESSTPESRQRDWRESWAGRTYPVRDGILRPERPSAALDGIYRVSEVGIGGFGQRPGGTNYAKLIASEGSAAKPKREIELKGFPDEQAVADTVPEVVYRFSVRAEG